MKKCTIILSMVSTSGGSATRSLSASLISESRNEEIVEDNQETKESETESISASSEGPKSKKVLFRRVGLLHEGAW